MKDYRSTDGDRFTATRLQPDMGHGGADELAAELRQHGHDAHREVIQGPDGVLHCVRVAGQVVEPGDYVIVIDGVPPVRVAGADFEARAQEVAA